MATCVMCGQSAVPELELALADGIRHYQCPPPEVTFHPERVCSRHKRVAPTCDECQHRHYRIDGQPQVNGQDIVSVTTMTREVGNVFGSAAWYGQRVGVEGVLTLDATIPAPLPEDPDEVVELLKAHRLTTNHVRDDASDRGTDVHAIAEEWARTGETPNPLDYLSHLQPYVEAFCSFLEVEQPEPLEVEEPVGSRAYAYAGTPDLVAFLPRLERALGLFDYKSKRKAPPRCKRCEGHGGPCCNGTGRRKSKAYVQHHFQVRMYEDARIEMGGRPSDFQAIVHLYPDGTYSLIQGVATAAHTPAVVAAYRAVSDVESLIGGGT
jgi:hypothetical protein